ncbi:aldehyde dehydrogenase family protein [Caldibacillus lycopersici]|uniref:Aldehyde dehydrogenase family protein n=1 Tax=Perspicuibacillus lycopersici TaxID=1325689 RepID=A0AAE3IUL6_9BACI|nr:aldehyde dehydrogenase family protein [Perspicuibacillus lycopersici]MCU9614888.1 aldehyde dehydrogenase family protein [Perspicuibacillus lycopersici]
MTTTSINEAVYIEEIIKKARRAQKIAEGFRQEKVDELAAAIAYEISTNEALVTELAEMAMEETQLGDLPSKLAKIRSKGRQIWYDVKNVKSVGIVEEIPEKGIVKIAKPVGVIGSLVPSTQPEMHPIVQSINSVKARDAIIFSPHPRGKKTTFRTVEIIRDILKKYDAPEDLIQCIANPSIAKTNELMKQSDLVIATGGHPMVKAAYSSGTPAYGVGAGNANIIIDKTADINDTAIKIKASKTFDLAAGCSCDNAVIIHEDVYDVMLKAFEEVGAYMISVEDKEKLKKTIWPDWPNNHVINRDIVAKPASYIADLAGIKIPENTSIILVEESGSGEQYPFSGEKMCVVTAVYKAKNIDEAIEIVNKNQAYSGAGHSCGIYSNTPENIEKVSLETYTTRVVVNQPQALTNTGSWTSGMPFTSSLGCGTWGGNIASENISLKHYLNNTWVIRGIPNYQPTDEELFSGFTPR